MTPSTDTGARSIFRPDPATAGEDDAVFAFLHACPIPSPGDVAAWGRRYPAHARAIADYAAIALEAAFSRDLAGDDWDGTRNEVGTRPRTPAGPWN